MIIKHSAQYLLNKMCEEYQKMKSISYIVKIWLRQTKEWSKLNNFIFWENTRKHTHNMSFYFNTYPWSAVNFCLSKYTKSTFAVWKKWSATTSGKKEEKLTSNKLLLIGNRFSFRRMCIHVATKFCKLKQ